VDDLPQKVHPTFWTVMLILAASQKLLAEETTWQALKTFQQQAEVRREQQRTLQNHVTEIKKCTLSVK